MKSLISLKHVVVRNSQNILLKDLNLEILESQHYAVINKEGGEANDFLLTLAGKLPVLKGELTYTFYDDYLSHFGVSDPLFTHRDLISYVSFKHPFRNLSNTQDFYYQQRFNSSDADNSVTVEEYLKCIKPSLKPTPWDYYRVLDLLHLRPLADEHIIKLSNGETKRLLIAAALIKNPYLILLDHPFTGLDVDTRKSFHEIVEEIAASGITLVMATSSNEIPDTFTHIIELGDRSIQDIWGKEHFRATQKTLGNKKKLNLNFQQLQHLTKHAEFAEFNLVVELKDIVIRYGERIILDHINWTIKQGEKWALSGPNGAGKTTLLSLINGDNPQAYANDILLFDKKRGTGETIWEIKEKIGFVSPELFQYFPSNFTCLQVVESGFYDTSGLFRKSDPVKALISQQWLELFKISSHADSYLQEVPAYIQRLCFLARALVKNPPLLILDEPSQGLTEEYRLYFKEIIEFVCREKKVTLIYVTHYKEEIPQCVNRFLELEMGGR